MTSDEGRPRNRRFRLIMGALAGRGGRRRRCGLCRTQDNCPQARSQAIVDDAAGTLGVDPGKLSDALKQALEKQVDAQVTAGKLTQEQADAIKERIADGTQPIFGGPGSAARAALRHSARASASARIRHGLRRPRPDGRHRGVATYLGARAGGTRAAQLRSGKSLADIAKAQGKTVDGLKTAITDAVTKRLDARRDRRQADEGPGDEDPRRPRRAPRRPRQRRARAARRVRRRLRPGGWTWATRATARPSAPADPTAAG